jgi:transcriptional regulator with XRE-family HTH domain
VSRAPVDLKALGAALRALRAEKRLTQERLSIKSGLTTALISDAENGKRNLSFQSIDRLLVVLGVSWDDFGAALVSAARSRRPK